jgi:integrase
VKGRVVQRSKGSWTIIFDAPRKPNGERDQKYETIRGTRKEAEKLLAQRVHEVNTGSYVPETSMTVAEYLEQWLVAHAAGAVSAGTYREYELVVRNHLVPALGSHRLDKLTPLQIKKFYTEARQTGRKDGTGGLSGASVRHCHVLLKQAYKKAVMWGLLRQSPFDMLEKADIPRVDDQERDAIPEDVLGTVLDAARPTSVWIPVVLVAGTGMRRGEICGLHWKDINLKEGELHVRHALKVLKGKLVIGPPKTKKGRRTIPLPSFLVEALVEHRAEQWKRQEELGPAYEDHDLVVPRSSGSYLYPDEISHGFRELTQPLGLKLRFHDLRHCHASSLLKYGENLKVVSERLGHASVAVTLQIYTHTDGEQHRRAADRIDEVIRRARKEQ